MKRFTCIVLATMSIAVTVHAADNPRETPVVRAFRSARDAVVNISTTRIAKVRAWPGFGDGIFDIFPTPGPLIREVPTHSLGSGFVIHPSGYIVTNAHVTQQATEITVFFADKTELKVDTVYMDTEHDLAVLKVKPEKRLEALALGRGNDLMIGETVIAIGNPLGYQHTVTVGVVSATGRELKFPEGKTYRHLIQTDASINPGNSGGPLLNINGELIGINSAIRGDAQNIGFAINVEVLKDLLPQLLDVEQIRRIDLGFDVLPSSSGRGVQVVSVDSGSPADQAGLQAGDMIFGYDRETQIDPIDFYVAMLERPEGKRLRLRVNRDGKTHVIGMPFEAKPKPDGRTLAQRKLGLMLTEVSADRAARVGLGRRPLVVVQTVVPGSPGSKLRIQAGDVIEQLGRYSVQTLDQVGQVLESVRRGQRIRIGWGRVQGNTYWRLEGQVEAR